MGDNSEGVNYIALADPGGILGPGPPPRHVGIFKAKEVTMSANRGRISAGHPDPILDPLEYRLIRIIQREF